MNLYSGGGWGWNGFFYDLILMKVPLYSRRVSLSFYLSTITILLMVGTDSLTSDSC